MTLAEVAEKLDMVQKNVAKLKESKVSLITGPNLYHLNQSVKMVKLENNVG